MFEMIGLLFGAIVFFTFSVVVGAVFGLLAWSLLRNRPRVWLKALVAALVPPACAVYMAICLVAFPGASLFGDIDEPLPHGYIVKALGKMPDYGRIETSEDGGLQTQLLAWVGSVDVEGDTVYGTYSHNFMDDGTPSSCCFAFDTANGATKNFETREAMDAYAHKQLNPVELPYFESREHAHVRLMRMEHWILLTPPAITMLLLAGILVLWRVTTLPEPA
jgi:hypothetical protein